MRTRPCCRKPRPAGASPPLSGQQQRRGSERPPAGGTTAGGQLPRARPAVTSAGSPHLVVARADGTPEALGPMARDATRPATKKNNNKKKPKCVHENTTSPPWGPQTRRPSSPRGWADPLALRGRLTERVLIQWVLLTNSRHPPRALPPPIQRMTRGAHASALGRSVGGYRKIDAPGGLAGKGRWGGLCFCRSGGPPTWQGDDSVPAGPEARGQRAAAGRA